MLSVVLSPSKISEVNHDVIGTVVPKRRAHHTITRLLLAGVHLHHANVYEHAGAFVRVSQHASLSSSIAEHPTNVVWVVLFLTKPGAVGGQHRV